MKDAYGVVVAPYISNDTARLCRENGVGYIDLAGNCFLGFDQIYVELKNFPNLTVEKRQLRSLFTPKSSRILRVMLANPRRSWMVKDLAKEAKVSIGLVFKVKERLLDLEFASEDNKSILGHFLFIEFTEDSPYLPIIVSYRAVISTSHVS